jgi:chromate transport protein ChrA
MRAPLLPFLRASSLHIGAAAAAASLRHDLVADGRLAAHEIDAAYAVSRITPGTNYLALYALLGHRLGGWPMAVQAVAVGTLVPVVVVLLAAIAYAHATSPLAASMRAGARAGGVAVFLGAAVRLLKPQLASRTRVGCAFAVAAFVAAWTLPVSLFLLLLVAGAAGAVWLRP